MGKYVKKMRLIFFCVNKKKGELDNSNKNSF